MIQTYSELWCNLCSFEFRLKKINYCFVSIVTFLACYFYIWASIRLENSDPNLRAVGRFLLKCLVATSSLKIQDGYNEKMLEKVGMLHFDTQGQIV